AQYTQTVLVANDPIYQPTILVDPLLQNGWGLALRPPGAGGHFWISNFGSGTTTTYVGDVHTPAGFLPLQQDSLKVVGIALGSGVRVDGRPVADPPQPTGQVYNYSTSDFVVSGEGITGASKFIFVTGEGTISGWTEQTDSQGVLHRQTVSVIKVDQSPLFDDDRLRYTGCAVTDYPSGNFLYVTNYIEDVVEVYDHLWQRQTLPSGAFTYPGEPQDYKPFNIQYFRSGPNGEGRLWVAYAQAGDPWEQEANQGAVAEFDLEGNFIRRLLISPDFDGFADSELKNPWGLAFAPANFGPMSGMLLVANFGDGTIAAFDPATMRFVDYLRDDNGEPLIVDGIWGMVVGNGVRLGDSNAIYFAAGPNSEIDGTFGTIRLTSATCPVIATQPVASVETCVGGDAHVSVSAPGPVAQT
ncbi:MAG: TIGR03118 family protein, partial [Phycisphaerales bacterium]